MKISLNWLAEYVDLDGMAPERVAELLSLHTAEVDEIEATGEAIKDVVVGEVVECGQHPDADKLSLTRVSYGGEEEVPVVCGAPNVRKGLKIAFAPVGSRLPGDLKIKKAKLRGQVSQGMICSTRELELGDDHDGILELDADAPIGASLVEVLGMRDHVLELDNKSLTHRPDLWGHYGFARELSVILQRPLRALATAELPSSASNWQVTSEDQAGCPLYLGLEIDLGGTPKPSPDWLQQRLIAVGQRPVNDIVDLSNYVLLELGQPTHAFDAAKLSGTQIIVRCARDGETMTTLDGVERKLENQDLVITDGSQPVALAGVMGGESSEVHDGTTRILLESAVFDPVRIRRTAQRLALRSEASTRFEKSLDPALADQALERFVELLAQIRPEATVVNSPARCGTATAPERVVLLDPAYAAHRLGQDIDAARAREILEGLGFGVDETADGKFEVRVPSWRATKDVTLPVDLEEELGRIYGYDKIQAAPLHAPVEVPAQYPGRLLIRRLLNRLCTAHGAAETQSYSFIDRRWMAALGLDDSSFVTIGNPVQKDVDLMRRDPVPSLLEQAAGNVRAHASGRLCEYTKGYEPVAGDTPRERRWLALVEWLPGDTPIQGTDSVFARLRGVAEDLLKVALPGAKLRAQPGVEQAWAHPAHAIQWRVGEQIVATACRLHPSILATADLSSSQVGVMLLDVDALMAASTGAAGDFHSPSRYPGIKLDVAVAMPSSLPYAEVEQALRKAGGSMLAELELFDLFEGAPLPDGERSLAFRALLQAEDRTLGEKEAQSFLKKVGKAATALGGSLRS